MLRFFQIKAHSKLLQKWFRCFFRNLLGSFAFLPVTLFCAFNVFRQTPITFGKICMSAVFCFGVIATVVMFWLVCLPNLFSMRYIMKLSDNEIWLLEKEFANAYENQSRVLGVFTDRGIVYPNGFAPWKDVKEVVINSTHIAVGASLVQGMTIDPCQIEISVETKLCGIPLEYVVGKQFTPYRDVSTEIEKFIDVVVSRTNGRVIVDNRYHFTN